MNSNIVNLGYGPVFSKSRYNFAFLTNMIDYNAND